MDRNSLLLWNRKPASDWHRDFDSLFGNWGQALQPLAASDEASFAPPVEVEEFENHFQVSLDMPGFAKDDIKIELAEKRLVVSGERKRLNTKEDGPSTYSERRYGKFTRTFAFKTEVDGAKVEASYDNGVLNLFVPKAESVKPRQIQIGGPKN